MNHFFGKSYGESPTGSLTRVNPPPCMVYGGKRKNLNPCAGHGAAL